MTETSDRRAARQREILEAAVRAFSRQGFHNCTVAQVAREAGIADGTLYLYFQGKEELLVSAFRYVLQRVLDRLDAELATLSDPVVKLKRLVEVHLAVMQEDPDVASFLQLQLRQPDTQVRIAIAEPLAAYARRIEAVLEEGKATGKIRTDVGTRTMRRLVFGAVDETVSAWLLRSGERPLTERAAPLVDLVLHGIVGNQTQDVGTEAPTPRKEA